MHNLQDEKHFFKAGVLSARQILSDCRSEAALLALVRKFINWMLPRAKVRHRAIPKLSFEILFKCQRILADKTSHRGHCFELPEGLDKTFHLLGFSLDADVGLKFPQGFVQLHAGEVHLIHHATVGSRSNRENKLFQAANQHDGDACSLFLLDGWSDMRLQTSDKT